MAATFRECPEAVEIGEALIRQHHRHLEGVRVEYVLRSDVPKRNGREVWGTCRKISSLSAYLASGGEEEGEEGEPFFCITLSEPVWIGLDAETREALLDHELCHAWADWRVTRDGERILDGIKIRSHDLEEFREVIERHGLWRADVKQFAKAAAEQLELELEADVPFTVSLNGGPEIETSIQQMRKATAEIANR